MGEVAIRTLGLGKMYRRGLRQDLASVLISGVKTLMTAGRLSRDNEREPFWALRDASIEVCKGERFGVVGRNGSGKSTFLKLLCGVTQPTAGKVEMYGRPTLLAVMGAGMSGELTGRENIYINGGILGASRKEVDRKFDDIVSFADLDRFIDTPIKYYSTGMFARLGFSIAVHIVNEILLLDEIMVVGDIAFQQKCIKKIKHITSNEGRTVFIVVHSNTMIKDLCDNGILLNYGKILERGDINDVIDRYDDILSGISTLLANGHNINIENQANDICAKFKSGSIIPEYINRDQHKRAVSIYRVAVVDNQSKVRETFNIYEDMKIIVEYEVKDMVHTGRIQVALLRDDGVIAVASNDHDFDPDIYQARSQGSYHAEMLIPLHILGPGIYTVLVIATNENDHILYDRVDAVGFKLVSPYRLGMYFDSASGLGRAGCERCITWTTTYEK